MKTDVISLQKERTQRSTLSPVSYGQSALWFLHQLAPDTAAYHVGFAVKVESRVDVEAMQRALESLTSRHASLRTTFLTSNGSPLRKIHAQLPPVLKVLQVGQVTQDELAVKVAGAYRAPFDLEAGPLLRAHLFSRAENSHVLLL